MRRRRETDTRTAILEAAHRVIADVGVSGATTREIARAAGCAEGTLYVHFESRFALLAGLFDKNVTIARRAMQALAEKVGLNDPLKNLAGALTDVRAFLERVMPILAGVYADHGLRKTFREKWPEAGFGPQRFRAHIDDYIRREQEIGRIARQVEPGVASEALLSLLFFQTFNDGLLPPSDGAALDVETLLRRLIS
jgi:AcrR family transcriptional regulator